MIKRINLFRFSTSSRVVLIGGGHANCLVLKNLKQQIKENDMKIDLTLVSETPVSYYSGMLPGAVAGLYKNEDIMVQLEPLVAWSNASWIQKRVVKIEG